jgi:hypothetical protein
MTMMNGMNRRRISERRKTHSNQEKFKIDINRPFNKNAQSLWLAFEIIV